MIINRQRRVPVKARSLEKFLSRATKLLELPADSATVCLVTDAQIAKWNRAYRGKSKPTDVLSFPSEYERTRIAASDNGNSRARPPKFRGPEKDYLGDIAIAPAVARRNARQLGRPFDVEMRILVLHGLIHLLGYDHETDRGEMDKLEQRLRRRLRLS